MIDLTDRFDEWVRRCETLISNYMETNYPTLNQIRFNVNVGEKYWKVISIQGCNMNIWAFVDQETGDIFKPIDWYKPVENAIGNLTDEFKGIGELGEMI